MAITQSLALSKQADASRFQQKHSQNLSSLCELKAGVHSRESAFRAELESYIHDAFARGYGATINHFLPLLMSLQGSEGELVAALGVREGGIEKLFLETYLDEPAEQRLANVTGLNVQRDSIVEIGNLASTRPGSARWLFLALAAYLEGRGTKWAIYTVAPFLKNTFLKLGFNLHVLAKANKSRLGENAKDWGSYYDASPEVMAVDVSQAFHAVLHFVEATGDDSLLHLCADAFQMGAHSRP